MHSTFPVTAAESSAVHPFCESDSHVAVAIAHSEAESVRKYTADFTADEMI